jgi:hypothetical protein
MSPIVGLSKELIDVASILWISGRGVFLQKEINGSLRNDFIKLHNNVGKTDWLHFCPPLI